MANPIRIRAAARDGVTEVRVLMSHVMETGQRKDASGAVIPAHFITELTVRHNDRVVLSAEFGPSVSANPYLAFKFNGGAKGDRVEVSWIDNKGDTRSDEVQIA
ncbi:thiosulfate oxidation carrier complex protein SoxZ [Thauera linaloolentis]|uniref:Phosphodiesterase I n=1 Tax=Thauera linaloolentis (strain DSM 12138 / JCM 21573 / CCUG 41526 / CIP 105981 / IAM 15112 / NBRC 102519 / 47Lol) TaxID=1123367 RepID=N6Z4W9_THAL4|nr:thiosulfate oxidation carrier complex protein SoxZ [Thauera linaloolentis]ENO89463.1 phosphodiesterase I [Thauera linaloolentis 47Lol = DSM 12138]MCM8566900.1 thiosulfate oxidation carrier complex protein SoxZ [Thauera linaloolentis]